MLCATMLCACCLGLAACGGSGSSSAAASGSASASASASSASASASSASASASSSSAAVDYAGDWKFAGMEADLGTGKITMVGDLEAIASAFGSDTSTMAFGLTLNADGTGKFVGGDESYDVAWVGNDKGVTLTPAKGDDSASASAASASASAASESASAESDNAFGNFGDSIDLVYADGVLSLTMDQDGQSATVYFSKDGKLPGATEIKAENAKPITSEADLIGEWKISGMNMMGLSIYGDDDALGAMMGSSGTDTSLTIEAGGKGTMSGSEFTYTVGADGAAMESGGITVPIKSLNGSLLLDMSDAIGMPMVIAYSK